MPFSTENGFAGTGPTPAPSFTYSFGSVTWGSSSLGNPTLNWAGTPPTGGTMDVTYWAGLPSNGCAPTSPSGTLNVIFSIEYKNISVSTGSFATLLWDTGIVTSATLPGTSWYALVGKEGASASACTVIQQGISITKPSTNTSISFSTSAAQSFTAGSTYVIELYYQ